MCRPLLAKTAKRCALVGFGLISGFAQYGGGDRTVVIAGIVGDSTSQATAQSMNQQMQPLGSEEEQLYSLPAGT